MAKKYCPKCSELIDVYSKICPECGLEKPFKVAAKKARMGYLLWVVIIVIAIISVLNLSTNDPNKKAVNTETKKEKCSPSDLQCLGDKHLFSAAILCEHDIEKMAKYSHKWTDGILEPKFNRFRWTDAEKKNITYIGDTIQFQNGFGAWQNHIYECDISPSTLTLIAVRVGPGSL